MLSFKGKKILVFGLKTSGLHVVRLLNHRGISLYLTDQAIRPENNLDAELNQYVPYETCRQEIDTFDILIKSPGIPDSHELVKAAKAAHVLVISEIEVAYQMMPKYKKIIAVTGTNGKTTTTTLITRILTEMGFRACSCGNIGYTFSEAVLVDLYDYFVIECSSFQLANIIDFKPDIFVLLNITPNHLDYHPSFQAYIEAKLNGLSNMTERDVVVYNADDPVLLTAMAKTKHLTYRYSLVNEHMDGYFNGEELVLPHHAIHKNELQLMGKENIANVLAACLVAEHLKVQPEIYHKVVTHFSSLKYRNEYLGDFDGVHFYNDAKATNPEATLSAIEAINKPLYLIMGGKKKEGDYAKVIHHPLVKMLFCFGENRLDLKKLADEAGKVAFNCSNLLEVMRLIKKVIVPGDIVLFSPGAQSFDQYQNYVERGEHFNQLLQTVISFKGE